MSPHRTLGVLGGMGPAATAEFLASLAVRVPARTDQEHPRIIMLSDPAIPERTDAILTGSDAPLPHIRDGLLSLAGWGADLLAVPCNTAHAFVDRVRTQLPVPVVHIVDATMREAMRVSPRGGWLAATTGTLVGGLYQEYARRVGYRLLVPQDTEQKEIHETSVLVKANRTDEAGDRYERAIRSLWQREELPVLAACTELPIAYAATGLPPDMTVSSLDALAMACAEELYRG
ncbi:MULTISPECIES: aspartate/glutamate racemase family protein [unclassified Streptomyces]|uniref:aspartate/glutamate racemase family protein n=1 Tax=unclassified Streptomyces TaxID=2593676 RepID=UPI0009390D30|nr:amino acid racemase [Streptomyces sp. CB02058]OKI94007.1 aspartate racemase [Streptomyces sp. CB02058]